ncbi:MAG: OmpH family outer membrane protein [Bacteroidaceae bacterium]|nr:OmpH family outer membrane protein [Bacteroidaceae bacterium]
MKRNLLILLSLVALTATAQSKFGYVSYREIVKALPEYTIVITHLDELQGKYEAEIARSEREFNQKYSDFIEEQASFPENIRIKRHKELQELMEKSIEFKDEVNRTMREARREMMKPLYEKVDEAVMKICIDEGYDYILNTDDRAYIAINPNNGKNVTGKLKKVLNLE